MRFAQRTPDRRLTTIIGRVAAPLRVAVHGRQGVGRAAVAAALAATGVTLIGGGRPADMHVVVIAEAVKPEDRATLAALGPGAPTLLVLNKADLTGFGRGGPMAAAQRRAAQCRTESGVPTVPMVALLAGVDLDGELVAALRTLTAEPGDLTSVDAFAQAAHRIPREVRARLLTTLDRFGIAHAVLALGRGVDESELPGLLRALSGIDEVAAQLHTAAAPVRYRRVRQALAELVALAARSGDDRIADFLAADDTVLAVMTAAVEVVEADGAVVDRGDEPAAHLHRALYWRRYSRGPVSDLHRSCGRDIARGSLRLLGRAR